MILCRIDCFMILTSAMRILWAELLPYDFFLSDRTNGPASLEIKFYVNTTEYMYILRLKIMS
jgi:hypothetical protein